MYSLPCAMDNGHHASYNMRLRPVSHQPMQKIKPDTSSGKSKRGMVIQGDDGLQNARALCAGQAWKRHENVTKRVLTIGHSGHLDASTGEV